MRIRTCGLLAIVSIAACDTTKPEMDPVLEVRSGNGQAGAAGGTLAEPLVVIVRSPDGSPLAGIDVSWSAEAGVVTPVGGATTDASGTTRAEWQLPAEIGRFRAMASLESREEVDFEATATVPPDASVGVTMVSAQALAGALFPSPVVVTSTLANGDPLGGATVSLDGLTSGWTFPIEAQTSRDGQAVFQWVPGIDLDQTVTGYIVGQLSSQGSSAPIPVAREWSRANSVYLTSRGLSNSTGFSTEVVPLTDEPATFFAVLMWDGGYAGLQRTGDLFDRQVHFSIWDADGVAAEVIDSGDSVCSDFGGEGTGKKCRFGYPWVVGGQYRFEMTVEPAADRTDVTLIFVDEVEDVRRQIGTLRYGAVPDLTWVSAFAEDFGPLSESCLHTAQRTIRIDGREQRVEDAWRPVPSARFEVVAPLEECANVTAEADDLGIAFGTGGQLVGDPSSNGVTLNFPEAGR